MLEEVNSSFVKERISLNDKLWWLRSTDEILEILLGKKSEMLNSRSKYELIFLLFKGKFKIKTNFR